MKKQIITLAIAFAFSAGIASAQTTWHAILSGLNENPANGSPGTGLGTLVLNAAQNQITVDESWSGLTTNATASHIHGPGGVGIGGPTNAPVLFPFSGVTATTSGAIPEQTFAISAAQVTMLQNGYLYFNVHSVNFPGGEIRGQIVPVPEPSTMALFGLGAGGLIFWMRRRTRARG